MLTARRARGIALPAALIAIVVTGGLIAGAFLAATQERRMAESERRLHQALGLAELGVGEVVAAWDPALYHAAPIFPGTGGLALPERVSGADVVSARVVRLNRMLYLLDVAAWDSAGAAGWGVHQRVGFVVRVDPVDLGVGAALTAPGGARLSGSVEVDGTDQNPAGAASCGPADTALAGLRVKGPTAIGVGATVQGNPAVQLDTTLGDDAIIDYGDISYDGLAARATLRLPGGTYRPFPSTGPGFAIVHIAGDATLAGGDGRGILLVDGDLTLEGSFQFAGVILVRGRLVAGPGGDVDVRLWGAVLAGAVEFELEGTGGRVSVNYSKCLMENALLMAARPVPLASRAWGQLF